MENNSCPTYNPLCATFIFMLGCVLGTYFAHSEGMRHDVIVIGVSTIVFYVTQIAQLRLSYSSKKIK